jgi:hypothetical protein
LDPVTEREARDRARIGATTSTRVEIFNSCLQIIEARLLKQTGPSPFDTSAGVRAIGGDSRSAKFRRVVPR